MVEEEECNDMVRLVSSDGRIFVVKKAVASQSVLINEYISELGSTNVVVMETCIK